MRQSRYTNDQLAQKAAEYRRNADESHSMSWPENSEHYVAVQIATAEVFEELLDWRMRAT